MGGVRHLYVHLPFCAHRCGYCDFVTVVGKGDQHGAYVDALLRSWSSSAAVLADGSRRSFSAAARRRSRRPARSSGCSRAARRRGGDGRGESRDGDARARGAPPRGRGHARLARRPELPAATARGARAARRRRRTSGGGSHALRDAGFDNVSLDLVYGIPGQSRVRPRGGPRGGAGARARAPLLLRARGEAGHAVHACARRGARAAGGRDGGLLRAGGRDADGGRLPLVRDGELLPRAGRAGGRDLRARHNLGYWRGRDYLGVGIGAVSTVGGMRWRNLPSLARYLGALAARRARRRARSSRSTRRPRHASVCCSGCVSTSRSRSPALERRARRADARAAADRGLIAVRPNGRG